MSNYLEYINEPEITDEPTALREVHAIRLFLREKTKDMSEEDITEHTRSAVREAEERLGVSFKRPGVLAVK